ncbi:MAG: hypothetical protein MZU97_14430 [Bacillus subtilis]|nr:hypothetical protein [Bacillus subtilis]
MNDSSGAMVIDSSEVRPVRPLRLRLREVHRPRHPELQPPRHEDLRRPRALPRTSKTPAASTAASASSACPTGAIREKDDIKRPGTRAPRSVQDRSSPRSRPPSAPRSARSSATSPARTSKARCSPPSARLGIDEVIDTNFTADLTIMEEGTEFIHRAHNTGGRAAALHLLLARAGSTISNSTIRNTCPNLSTCKSPQQMAGALIKTYYAAEARTRSAEHRLASRSCPASPRRPKRSRPDMGTTTATATSTSSSRRARSPA